MKTKHSVHIRVCGMVTSDCDSPGCNALSYYITLSAGAVEYADYTIAEEYDPTLALRSPIGRGWWLVMLQDGILVDEQSVTRRSSDFQHSTLALIWVRRAFREARYLSLPPTRQDLTQGHWPEGRIKRGGGGRARAEARALETMMHLAHPKVAQPKPEALRPQVCLCWIGQTEALAVREGPIRPAGW